MIRLRSKISLMARPTRSSSAPDDSQPSSAKDAVVEAFSFFSRQKLHGVVMQRTPDSSTIANGPAGGFGP
jgi:hypothetical protein